MSRPRMIEDEKGASAERASGGRRGRLRPLVSIVGNSEGSFVRANDKKINKEELQRERDRRIYKPPKSLKQYISYYNMRTSMQKFSNVGF